MTMSKGLNGYNYFAENRRVAAAPVTGINLKPPSPDGGDTNCIRTFDDSVTAGGFPGLPINPGSVGMEQLGTNFYPAPTYGTNSITGIGQNGLSCGALASVIFTNVPQDGFVNRILWLFRVNGASNWTPWAETALTGLPFPPTSVTETFAYGDLTNGLNYDFGAAYVASGGNIGMVSAYKTNIAISAIGIGAPYMLGGSLATPTLSNQALTNDATANGLAAAVKVEFKITNQPTDGSLSRISVFFCLTGAGTPTFYASIPAAGVGLATPPSTGDYTGANGITLSDLTSGVQYDVFVCMEDTQGGDSALTQVGTTAITTISYTATASVSYNTAHVSNVGATFNLLFQAVTTPAQPGTWGIVVTWALACGNGATATLLLTTNASGGGTYTPGSPLSGAADNSLAFINFAAGTSSLSPVPLTWTSSGSLPQGTTFYVSCVVAAASSSLNVFGGQLTVVMTLL